MSYAIFDNQRGPSKQPDFSAMVQYLDGKLVDLVEKPAMVTYQANRHGIFYELKVEIYPRNGDRNTFSMGPLSSAEAEELESMVQVFYSLRRSNPALDI